MKIYLAGGMSSGWQDKVVKRVEEAVGDGVTFHDPRKHSRQYSLHTLTTDDYWGVGSSDLVFAYFEKDNPSGLGMCLELGYAHALQIPIIFVDEHQHIHGMVASTAVRILTDLDTGIDYLIKWARKEGYVGWKRI